MVSIPLEFKGTIYNNISNISFRISLLFNPCSPFINPSIITLQFKDPAIKEPKHLPMLELASGNQIFLSDAAANYLLSDVEQDSTARNQVIYINKINTS